MLEMYMVRGAFGYGCYSEVVVLAESKEDAMAIIKEEAAKEPGLYESYTRFPEDIEIECWGPPSRGVLSESGADV